MPIELEVWLEFTESPLKSEELKGTQSHADLGLSARLYCLWLTQYFWFWSFLHPPSWGHQSSYSHWWTSHVEQDLQAAKDAQSHPDLLPGAYCQVHLSTLPPILLLCFIINLVHIRSHIPSNFYVLWVCDGLIFSNAFCDFFFCPLQYFKAP